MPIARRYRRSESRLHREVEFGALGLGQRRSRRDGHLVVRRQRLDHLELGGDQLHAVIHQMPVDLSQLLLRELKIGQPHGELIVRQVPPIESLRN